MAHIDPGLAPDGPVVSRLRLAFPELLAVYAFGSRVQGTSRPDSDIDLAVLVAGYADPLTLWDAAGALADQLGQPVDLLDLRAASTVMQHQVLTGGQQLWARQPAAGLFECFVMSEKTALDVARRALLTDIGQRGSVYGR
jgi:predicted nucleotidyltransferase